MPAYDPRAIKGIGTTYATSPMGADHTAGYTVTPEVFEIGRRSDPFKARGKVVLSTKWQESTIFLDSAGLCIFISFATAGDERGLLPVVEMINAKYGTDFNEDYINKMGSEILSIEKDFNLNAGISKFANDVPEFMRHEKLDTHGTLYDIDKKKLFNF